MEISQTNNKYLILATTNHAVFSIFLLTRDDQTDGEALVEDPDLTLGLEDSPGQPEPVEGDAGGQ